MEPCDIWEKSMPGKGKSRNKAANLVQKEKSSKRRRNEEDRSEK